MPDHLCYMLTSRSKSPQTLLLAAIRGLELEVESLEPIEVSVRYVGWSVGVVDAVEGDKSATRTAPSILVHFSLIEARDLPTPTPMPRPGTSDTFDSGHADTVRHSPRLGVSE